MLYNGRFNEKHDFIAVEIINQQIQLTFSAGTETTGTTTFFLQYIYEESAADPPHPLCFSGETKTTVSPHVVGGVSDGLWHLVDIHYYNKVKKWLSLQREKKFLIQLRFGRNKMLARV